MCLHLDAQQHHIVVASLELLREFLQKKDCRVYNFFDDDDDDDDDNDDNDDDVLCFLDQDSATQARFQSEKYLETCSFYTHCTPCMQGCCHCGALACWRL